MKFKFLFSYGFCLARALRAVGQFCRFTETIVLYSQLSLPGLNKFNLFCFHFLNKSLSSLNKFNLFCFHFLDSCPLCRRLEGSCSTYFDAIQTTFYFAFSGNYQASLSRRHENGSYIPMLLYK